MMCPICNRNISEWDELAQQHHINECIDAVNLGNSASSCPVCGVSAEGLDKHVTQCLLEQENKLIYEQRLTQTQQKAVDICHRRAKIFSSNVLHDISAKLVSFGSSDVDADCKLLESYIRDRVR